MTLTSRLHTSRLPESPPRTETFGLIAVAGAALAAGLVLGRPGVPGAIVALAGAALALGVPGLALTRALFPGHAFGRGERLTLVVGMQLSLLVMCGFLLHLLRPGLTPAAWGALLADISLVACGVAWIRGRRGTTSSMAVPPVGPRIGLAALGEASTSQLTLLMGAGLVAVLALVVARAGVVAQPQPSWTALAIEPADGGRAVSLRIANAEGRPETYRLVATVDGVPVADPGPIVLANGAATNVTIPLPAAGAFLRQVDVGLWRADDAADSDAYRSVRLSLRGVPGP